MPKIDDDTYPVGIQGPWRQHIQVYMEQAKNTFRQNLKAFWEHLPSFSTERLQPPLQQRWELKPRSMGSPYAPLLHRSPGGFAWIFDRDSNDKTILYLQLR